MSKVCIKCDENAVDNSGNHCKRCREMVAKARASGLASYGLTEADLDPKANPKHNMGVNKYPMSPVPVPVLAEIGVAMLEGALKYGYYNFRSANISASTYYDAANRHIQAWWEGEEIDPDSGINHITKAIASLVVLRDSIMNDRLVDDRPPATSVDWKASLNAIAEKLHKKYADEDVNIVSIGNSWPK